MLKSYAGTYLKEEIQAEALTRNLDGFSRFLYVAAEQSGHFLDLSKMASKAKVSRTGAVRFFELLEDTLIAHRVPVYPCPAADMVKHDRYFFFDVGVLNGLLGTFDASSDRQGFLFEHLLFNQIRVSAAAQDKPCRVFGFRTRGGLEIDFVVEIEGQTWAIEAKSARYSDARVMQSMAAVSTYLPADTKYVVASADEAPPKRQGKVQFLSWQAMLKAMGL